MKDRLKEGIKKSGYSVKEIAELLGLSYDAFRKSINRGSLNEGYLIMLEHKTGISKDYILEGTLPIIKSKEDIVMGFVDNDTIKLLDCIDKEKIISYLLFREKDFSKIESFRLFIEKQKVSKRLKDIFSDNN